MNDFAERWVPVWKHFERELERVRLDAAHAFERLQWARSREEICRLAFELTELADLAEAYAYIWRKDYELCKYESRQRGPNERYVEWSTPSEYQENAVCRIEEQAFEWSELGHLVLSQSHDLKRLGRLIHALRLSELIDGAGGTKIIQPRYWTRKSNIGAETRRKAAQAAREAGVSFP